MPAFQRWRAWRTRTVVLGSLLLAGACGRGGSAFADDFTNACLTSSNMPESTCRCMADKALAELSSDERTFVLAVLKDDDAGANAVRGKLGLEGAMKAGMFMTRAGQCAPAPQSDKDS